MLICIAYVGASQFSCPVLSRSAASAALVAASKCSRAPRLRAQCILCDCLRALALLSRDSSVSTNARASPLGLPAFGFARATLSSSVTAASSASPVTCTAPATKRTAVRRDTCTAIINFIYCLAHPIGILVRDATINLTYSEHTTCPSPNQDSI
jgi:hypothetical protein